MSKDFRKILVPGDIIDHIEEEEKGREEPRISLKELLEYYRKSLLEQGKEEKVKQIIANYKESIPYFELGYSDGSIIEKVSTGQFEELKKLGAVNESGIDTLKGAVVVPLYGGELSQLRGIMSIDGKRGTGELKGIFHEKILKVYEQIFIAESIEEVLETFEKGLLNVCCTVGTGETEIFQSNRVKSVIMSYQDEEFTGKLKEAGIKVKVLRGLLQSGTKEEIEKRAEEEKEGEESENAVFHVEREGSSYHIGIDGILYHLYEVKEVFVNNLKVGIKAEYEGELFPDRVDLYSSRSRTSYSMTLSKVFGVEAKRVERDLLKILFYLEEEREKLVKQRKEGTKREELTDEEKSLGLSLLKSPVLFQEIADDMEVLGYVGEDLNKMLMYLCASSRIQDDPISVLMLSSSASGKSMLADTVKLLIPPEEVISAVSLSDQALNYIDDLKHKFLVFGESVHNETIEHQIREMLSSRELSRLVTRKNEETGKMVSEVIKKEVIVASTMSTTNYKMNPENMSRFFVINADESEEQTRRIHEAQREKFSVKRMVEKKELVPEVLKKHHAAQRLLHKVTIVNQFGKYLDYPAGKMRTRRDNDRFIDLIACVCFLRQYQKEEKKQEGIQYIECDLKDYEIARNIVVNCVLSATLSEFPKSLISFYGSIREIVGKKAKESGLSVVECSFDFRDIRKSIQNPGSETMKKYMRTLVSYDYLYIAEGGSRGQRSKYRLVADEEMEKVDISIIPTVEEVKERIETLKDTKSRTSG